MPEARLARTRENNRCPMCGQDALVGKHERIETMLSVFESCPTRSYSATICGTIVVEDDSDQNLWGV